MYSKALFFHFINEKTQAPHLRESLCYEQALTYLRDKASEKDYFRTGYTDSDLTESCYRLFIRSGSLSPGDGERLEACLKQTQSGDGTDVLDAVACFAKELQEKIILGWHECVQGEEPVVAILRDAIGEMLQYENFYIPVAQQSYGYGVDEELAFSLSVSSTLTEWPGELPSFGCMLRAFACTIVAGERIEQRMLALLEEISVGISRGLSPAVDLDKLFAECAEYVAECFEPTTDALMRNARDSEFEYRNFYYWLLSDMYFDALGIRQITAYYVDAVLKGEAVENVRRQKREAYECSISEKQKWFQEWCANENY